MKEIINFIKFFKSLKSKKRYELAEIKNRLVTEKMQAHRAGDKDAVFELQEKIKLVEKIMRNGGGGRN